MGMFIYKLAGGIMLVLCGYFGGRTLSKKKEYDLEITEGWLTLVRHIRNQIDCFNLPLKKIIAMCPGEILAQCGIGETVNAGMGFTDLVAAVEDRVPAGVFSHLEKLSSELGNGYRETQLKLCDYYISKLQGERDKLAADLPKHKKMVMTLCLCASAGVLIILL